MPVISRTPNPRPRLRSPFAALLCLAAFALLACAPGDSTPAEPEPSPLADLGPGWNPIEPGGETICSDGSPYRFFVRVGDPEKLMVYLQGGGGCWTGETCDPDGRPTYKRVAETELRSAAGTAPEEGALHGVFAFGHPENPFAGYSVVLVPYCTGDVHLGDTVAGYTAPAGTTSEGEEHPEHEVAVHHKGWVNGQAALAWTAEHFAEPETVFVTGSSAGAIPSPVYARQLAETYPGARVVQLGDGAGGYRNLSQAQPHTKWAALDALASRYPEFGSMPPDEFSFEALYTTTGKAAPAIQLARYDTAEDETQIQFLRISQTEVDSLQPLLDANEADIDAAISNYVSYVAPGTVHTILLRPELYSYEVNGVRFRDWLAALAAGEPVDDVHCGVCDQPPAPVQETATATAGSSG
ncbi:MAG TPA: pectin acetylesterase-family hydrolase [Thermoanaerobaculia bacterium]|nr:pectin acetylesterase-family hydrolase [Thermoanaerobaculia bacterium]